MQQHKGVNHGTKTYSRSAWAQVLINGRVAGLVTSASYSENFGVQPAKVLGFQGPITYDAQDYSCTINMGSFVPERPNEGPWPDGGEFAISELLPTRSQIQSNDGKPAEFDSLQFVNLATGQIINSFRNVVLSSNGSQLSPNSYLTIDMQFMAVERTV